MTSNEQRELEEEMRSLRSFGDYARAFGRGRLHFNFSFHRTSWRMIVFDEKIWLNFFVRVKQHIYL